MKLGIRVGLGPGHIVLDGDPAPLPPKGHTPNFRPISNFGSPTNTAVKVELMVERGHLIAGVPNQGVSQPRGIPTEGENFVVSGGHLDHLLADLAHVSPVVV